MSTFSSDIVDMFFYLYLNFYMLQKLIFCYSFVIEKIFICDIIKTTLLEVE